MKHTLILETLPTRLNRLYQPVLRAGRPTIIKTKEGKDAEKTVRMECVRQGVKKPFTGFVSLYIDMDLTGTRGADIDAYQKLLQDSLEGYAYVNDSQIIDLRVRKHFNQAKARLVVSVQQISEEEAYAE